MKQTRTIATCEVCSNQPGTNRATIDGKYYRAICKTCTHPTYRSKGDAQYKREAAALDNAKDIQQPWNPDGTPNKLFIEAYPDVAKITYSKEELIEHDKSV